MVILIGIIMLGLIILVHELGHFLTAKIFKMPVSEFSIGVGPQILSFETEKTMYSIRSIPLGGYVNIEGMEIGSEVEDGFNSKERWKRFIVLFAGVFMNFFSAFLLLIFINMSMGKIELDKEPVIGKVSAKSLNNSVLFSGDKILKIEDVDIFSWENIREEVEKNKDKKEIKTLILRNGTEKEINLKLMKDENSERIVIGISQNIKKTSVNFKEATVAANKNFKSIFTDTLKGFLLLFKGKVKVEDLSGPIGIFKVVGETNSEGIMALLTLAVILSINIGILNLLPIPALDGGRIIFVLLEYVGVKINKKNEEKLHRLGMYLLLFLIFMVSINDIIKIFN